MSSRVKMMLAGGALVILPVLAGAQQLADEQPADGQPAQPAQSESPSAGELILEETREAERRSRDLVESRSIPYQEHRIGGRLERVTVTRENGFTETYRNNRADTIWSAEENELGEVPNMRQWVIRTW